MALGISLYVFLYVKQMTIYYTNRSGYCKRQRPSLRNKYRTWKYTYRHRTVNYCFFCYFVFWIPTIQDTIFIFNRNSTTVTNGIIELFSRRSPKLKETFRVHVEHNTMTVGFWLSIFRTYRHTFFFFCFITTLPREAVTNCTLGLASAKKQKKQKKHLAYVHKYTFSFQLWPKCTRF